MAGYIVKRIAVAILTLLIIICITFLLMNAVPGSPFLTEKSTPEMIARANAKYGLDKPLYVQLFNYIKNYARGDLGTSLKMQEGTSVSKIIFHQGKFVLSLKLGLYALLLAVVIGIPLGCIAAYNRGSWIDGFLRVVTTVGVAVPTFVLATLLLVTFAVKLQVLPTLSGSLPDFKSYVMPVISLSFYYTCYVAKLTRTSMLDAINQDYIRTARAKGVKTRALIARADLKARAAQFPHPRHHLSRPGHGRHHHRQLRGRVYLFHPRSGQVLRPERAQPRLSRHHGHHRGALRAGHPDEPCGRHRLQDRRSTHHADLKGGLNDGR